MFLITTNIARFLTKQLLTFHHSHHKELIKEIITQLNPTFSFAISVYDLFLQDVNFCYLQICNAIFSTLLLGLFKRKGDLNSPEYKKRCHFYLGLR